jgi:hypothetical protein
LFFPPPPPSACALNCGCSHLSSLGSDLQTCRLLLCVVLLLWGPAAHFWLWPCWLGVVEALLAEQLQGPCWPYGLAACFFALFCFYEGLQPILGSSVYLVLISLHGSLGVMTKPTANCSIEPIHYWRGIFVMLQRNATFFIGFQSFYYSLYIARTVRTAIGNTC